MLVAASAWAGGQPASCNYINIKTLPIEFAGIRPTIDGHAARMLIDTGSDQTVLLRFVSCLGFW